MRHPRLFNKNIATAISELKDVNDKYPDDYSVKTQWIAF